MLTPAHPANESLRLQVLDRMDLVGAEIDDRCQRYARLARRLFGVPIAALTIVGRDRQWFRGREGLVVDSTARDVSFCGHAILGAELFQVEDASLDARFADNPLVTGEPAIRFYAGCPIVLPGDIAIGTLCVIDRRARALGNDEAQALRDLADCARSEFATLLSVADMHDVARDLFRMLPDRAAA